MNILLGLSGLIDRLNERVGRAILWLVLAAVLISSVNATVRKLFDVSSNAYLEMQWYLFAAIFLLGAGYTLLHNEHIRIDVLAGRLSRRAQAWIDVFGILFFLLPMAGLILWTAVPFALHSWQSQEMSWNAGGLILWPVKALLPLGFTLLILQAISELIKRVAFLRGLIPDPTEKHGLPSAEEELIETLRQSRTKEQGRG